jgi:serine O-acetyltransferase
VLSRWRRSEPNPHLAFKEAVLANRRERFPGLTQAVLEDAKVWSAFRNERYEFRNVVDGWMRAIRLMWVTDAFFGFACYRAKAAAQKRGLPIIPRLAHKAAMRNAQICIGDPVIIEPGIYVPHGQMVIDGLVEIRKGAILAPWISIGLVQGNPQGPMIGRGAMIGTGARVLGPWKVGAGSTVAANAVVTKDVPDGVIVAGSPAKEIQPGGGSTGGARDDVVDMKVAR